MSKRPPAPLTERQRAGAAAEARALDHLRRAGLVLVARNVRYRGGEIDLLMRERDTLVFVEVRYRRNATFGGAAASITQAKQHRIVIAAQLWLQQHHGARPPPCRFDVVAMDGTGGLDWLRAAFCVA